MQNENILVVLNFVVSYFEAFAEFMLIFSLLNKKFNLKKLALTSIILSIVGILLKEFSPQYLNSFLYPFIIVVLIKSVFKEKLFNSTIATLICMILLAIVDSIISSSIILSCNLTDFVELTNTPSLYNLGMFLIASVILLIAGIIYYSRSKNLILNIEQSKHINIVITVVTTFMLLIPNLMVLLYYRNKTALPFGIIFINICSIIILFFVSIYNTRNNIKLAKSEQDLVAQQKYSKTQQDLIDGLRTFKHDYSNTLQTMRGYVEYNKIDKLKEMFEQVLDETKAITTLDKLNPNTIKNPGLFGILSGKYQKAKENNLKMEIEIFGDIEGIDIEIFDLTRVLGILLDNAIEAAKNSKKRKVKFMLTERKNEVSFEITNTYSGKKIDLEKIKEKGVSSKGKERGLGLYKVEEIVHKYDSVENSTEIYGDTFIQILTISKKILIKA